MSAGGDSGETGAGPPPLDDNGYEFGHGPCTGEYGLRMNPQLSALSRTRIYYARRYDGKRERRRGGGEEGCSYGNHDTEYIQRIERSGTIFHQTFDVQKSDANGYESEAAEDRNAAQDDLDGVPTLLALGLHTDEVLPLIAIARVAAGALLLLLPL